MIKTKIKKAIAIAWITTIAATSAIGGALSTYANIQIGTGSVTWTSAFDTAINWNETYSANSASWSVENIIVTATILPVLNMKISTGAINLGNLSAGITSTWTLDIEVGTNAANGVTITSRSWSGWLTNTSDNSIKINNLSTDGAADSYTFSSTALTNDSTVSWYTQSSDYPVVEINDNTTEHTIYSTNKPEQDDATNADVTFAVAATPNIQTAAWNYQDTITFTVTGNF